MTWEQYLDKKHDLETEFAMKLNALKREYALLNNPYKVDDIFTDHIGSIKIVSFRAESFSGKPSVSYLGFILNKDGTLTKRKENTRRAYLSNDINLKP